MSDWRLLLTRPAEESQILAATLAAHGVFSSSLPLLAIEVLPDTAEQQAVLQQLDGYSAVIVISKPAAQSTRIDVGKLTSGVYFVRVATRQGMVLHQEKIIKE